MQMTTVAAGEGGGVILDECNANACLLDTYEVKRDLANRQLRRKEEKKEPLQKPLLKGLPLPFAFLRKEANK